MDVKQWNTATAREKAEYLLDNEVVIKPRTGMRADAKVNDPNPCVTVWTGHVVEKLPSDACRTRLELALVKGRNVPKLIEWLERCDKFSEYDTQESNGVKLGDELGYVVTKRTSGGYNMTQKYGRVFVITDNKAMLCINGGLRSVSLEKESE